MTMPWSTQDAEQDALELTDIGTERLLRSLYELESPFFVHLVIEAALLSARVTAYGILVQPQPGFDGEEVNDFVLQRDQLDIDAVVRLEALLAFQHQLSEEQIRAELGLLFDIVQLREFRFDQVETVGVRFLGWSCLVRRRDG